LKLELVVWQGGRPQKDVVMLVVVLFHSSVDMTKHQFMAQTKDISEKDLKIISSQFCRTICKLKMAP
jgi:hypothetical protein